MLLSVSPNRSMRDHRGYQRQRQRQQGDERRASVHQEHDDHDQDHQTRALEQRLEQVVERLLDEVGLPEEVRVDPHARRQAPLDVVERGLDPLGSAPAC